VLDLPEILVGFRVVCDLLQEKRIPGDALH
jgi:hypothetical protein